MYHLKHVIIAFLLFFSLSAQAEEFPGQDRSNTGINVIWFTLTDATTTGTASGPETYGCYDQDGSLNALVLPFTYGCTVPAGWSYQIHTFTGWVNQAMGVNERCKFSVANRAGTVSAWSTITAGTSTTSTCDSSDGEDGVLDAPEEYCVNTDVVGTTFGPGDGFIILIEEESAGNCDQVLTMTFLMEYIPARVATP